MKYVVVSEEEGLYDIVSRRICEENPDSVVSRAGTFREAVAILEKSGSGVLLTDLKKFERRIPSAVSAVKPVFPDNNLKEVLSYIPEKNEPNTKADLGFVKRYVRMHLDADLSMEKLSRIACLSPNYLSSLFKKKEGEPLKRYVERHRVERAAYLLVTEESTIAEISVKVGYRYCSHFCSVFKEYYGVSPLQYRISHREKKSRKRRYHK